MKTNRLARLVVPALLAAATSPAIAQVTIDSFTTNQATLSAPPDASSTATGGADIIGTRRGIVMHEVAGTGPSTVAVTGGNLTLFVSNTTPDSRAEARLSWDNDTDATVLNPAGLGGVTLLTGNATGLRVRVASSGANAELEVTVYSSATNLSKAARLLPAIGSPTDVLIPFAEFRAAGSVGGANFASVGAIELTVRGREITVVLDEINTTLPLPAATKVDAQVPVDVDGDGRVDPGDRVRYTVTFTNTGNNAVNVDLTDTVDANTTLDAGSVSSTPLARNDQYGWFGNLTLSADGTPFPALLANDADPDGDTVTVQSVVSPSAQGGTVTLNNAATGEFTYVPPAGFKGVDSFSYTINDGEAHTSTAIAYIHLEGVVWFVDNGCTVGCGAGTQASPFLTLPAAEGPSGENDIIYVRTGIAAYDTGPVNGFTMDVDEQLLGEGVALVLGGTTIVPAGAPPTLTNNDGTPGRGVTLAGTGAGTDTVRGLTIGATTLAKIFGNGFGTFASDTLTLNGNGQALDLGNGTLSASFLGITSGSSAGTGVTLNQVGGSLTSAGGTSVTNPTTQGILVGQSTVDASFGNTSITGTGTDRISLQSNSAGTRTFGTITTSGGSGVGVLHAVGGGTTTVTGATSITNPGGIGVSISGSTTAVSFQAATIDKAASSGTGLSITGSTGTTSFASLGVTTSAGTGILMTGSALSLGGSSSTVAATGGPALDLTTVNLGAGATFSSASSTGSTGKGMNLDTLTGSLTMNGGSIGTPAGIAFDLNAGAANVTYSGAISNVANALLIDITGRTGGTVALSGNLSSITLGDGINVSSNTGGTINFSGGTKILTTGASAAVTLSSNAGTTVNFTGGGLAITTTSGAGFNATGGAAAVTVQGSANTITSSGGTALNVSNSTIGAPGLFFLSISANGGTNGIVLTNTGSTAGLNVTGTGSTDASGGVIQNTSADGVVLTGTRFANLSNMVIGDATATPGQVPNATNNVGGDGIAMTNADDIALDNLKIARTGAHGIDGTGVTNLTIANSEILNAGDGNEENALDFADLNQNNLDGTVQITNCVLDAFAEDGIFIENFSGDLNLTVSGTTFRAPANTLCGGSTCSENGIQIRGDGTARYTMTVGASTQFNAVDGNGILAIAEGTAAAPSLVSISNTTFTNTVALGIVLFGGTGDATSTIESRMNFTIGPNVTLTGTNSTAISIQPNGRSRMRGTVTAAVNGSTIGRGIEVLSDDASQAVVSILDSTVSNTAFNGIFAANQNVGQLDLHVRNNNVSAPLDTTPPSGLAIHGTEINLRETSVNCLDIASNISAGNGPSGGAGYRTRQRDTSVFELERFTGAGNNTTDVQNFLVAQNVSGTGSATVATTYTGVANGACEDP
jgi:hypothetical protein